jgi:CDP-diglyceride synthetase
MKLRVFTGFAIGLILFLALLFLPHLAVAIGYMIVSCIAVFEITAALNFGNYSYKANCFYWCEFIMLVFAMTAVIVSTQNFEIGYIIILCALVDVGGYTAGNIAGKNAHRVKLLQNISPKKSWEGYITGVICSVVVGYLLYIHTPLREHLPPQAMYFCLFAWIPAIAGDLFESKLKRILKLKDSSDYITKYGDVVSRLVEKPISSHGGYLDRIDSFVFTVVAYQVFLAICRE